MADPRTDGWHVDLDDGYGYSRPRLIFWRTREAGYEFLTADGAVISADEGAELPPAVGFPVPRTARAVLIEAFAEMGDAGTLETLRDALDVERRRVDELLARIGTLR